MLQAAAEQASTNGRVPAPSLAGADLSEPVIASGSIPTQDDILDMLGNPVVRAALNLLTLPVKRAKLVVVGDEAQADLLRAWREREYESFTRLVWERAIVWGYGGAEYTVVPKAGQWLYGDLLAPHPTQFRLAVEQEDVTRPYLDVRYPANVEVREHIVWHVHNGDPRHTTRDQWGNSFPNSALLPVWWSFREFREIWRLYNSYLKRHGVPPTEIEYPTGQTGGADNSANETAAKNIGKGLRRLSIVPIPMERDSVTGEWRRAGWGVKYVESTNRTVTFLDPIDKLADYIYSTLGVPRKLLEQGSDAGSFAMVTAQDTRFAQVLESYAAAWQAALWRDVWEPMLLDNFGRVDVESVSLDLWGAEDTAFQRELLAEAVKAGRVTVDWTEIANAANVPMREGDVEQTDSSFEGQFETAREKAKAVLGEKVVRQLEKLRRERAPRVKALLDALATETVQEMRKRVTQWAEGYARRVKAEKWPPVKLPGDRGPGELLPRELFEGYDELRVRGFAAGLKAFGEETGTTPPKLTLSPRRAAAIEGAADILWDYAQELQLALSPANLSPAERAKAVRDATARWLGEEVSPDGRIVGYPVRLAANIAASGFTTAFSEAQARAG